MRYQKQTLRMLFILALLLSISPLVAQEKTNAATSPRLNRKRITVRAWDKKPVTLKVKNTKKKAKWTVTSGKKNLRLTKKKKRSVQLVALRHGKATVRCKVGKKKLYCKITTITRTCTPPPQLPDMIIPTPTEKPSILPAPSPEPQPTATPSPTPAGPSAKPTVAPRATHTPTENRLMAEPKKYDSKSNTSGEYKVEYSFYGWKYYYFFGSDIRREDIERIAFTDTSEVPSDALGSLDVSEKQNQSVMAWYTDIDGDDYYEMTIGQDGGVIANPDSSYLFYDIGFHQTEGSCLYGLEHFYTDDVTDMSFMFMRFGTKDLTELYLPAYFDTSNVENMSHMFTFCGENYMTSLYLDTGFITDKVTNDNKMFFWCGRPTMVCYTPDETLHNWITSSEENEWKYATYGWRDEENLRIHNEYMGPTEPEDDMYYIMPGNTVLPFNKDLCVYEMSGDYIYQSETTAPASYIHPTYYEEFYKYIDDMTEEEVQETVMELIDSGEIQLSCSDNVERVQVVKDAGYFYCGYHGEMGLLLFGEDGIQNFVILYYPDWSIPIIDEEE